MGRGEDGVRLRSAVWRTGAGIGLGWLLCDLLPAGQLLVGLSACGLDSLADRHLLRSSRRRRAREACGNFRRVV